MIVELLIGNLTVLLRIVTFPDDGCLICTGVKMTVNTVIAGIECAIFEPAYVNVFAIPGYIFYLAERFNPVDSACLFRPETGVVFD